MDSYPSHIPHLHTMAASASAGVTLVPAVSPQLSQQIQMHPHDADDAQHLFVEMGVMGILEVTIVGGIVVRTAFRRATRR